MDKEPRTAEELYELSKRPGMNFPEALMQTSEITDINLEVLEVYDVIPGTPERKAHRGVLIKFLCHEPPTEEEKDIEYLRKRVNRRSPVCMHCYNNSPEAETKRKEANAVGMQRRKELAEFRAKVRNRKRKRYEGYQPLTDRQWKEKLVLWNRLV